MVIAILLQIPAMFSYRATARHDRRSTSNEDVHGERYWLPLADSLAAPAVL